jgi:protein SCO1/2
MHARIALGLMGIIAVGLIALSVRFLLKANGEGGDGQLSGSISATSPPAATAGEGSLRVPTELAHAQIEDKAGAKLPLDVKITDQNGEEKILGSYFSEGDKRPVILTLGYYGCPMLCSLVLNGLVEALKQINFTPGKDFRLVSVSIDERERPALAKQKQKAYLGALNADENVSWWNFHVTSAGEARRLADAVGFGYEFDKKIDQFAHGAGFFVLSPEGILSRTLFGISYAPTDVKLALSEATDGKIGSFIDRVLLSCFHYDPDAHRYGVYIFGVMRLGGILTVIILGSVLLFYFRQEKKRILP